MVSKKTKENCLGPDWKAELFKESFGILLPWLYMKIEPIIVWKVKLRKTNFLDFIQLLNKYLNIMVNKNKDKGCACAYL